MSPAAELDRTSRSIVAGTWGCAVITMAGSAASAAVAYDFLGEHWGLGLAAGIAVDVALCVALVGDRRLYTHGVASNWGRALRVTTALMSLVLNSGVAFATGRYFLGALHAFLPILLVVLMEYGQDALLKLSALQRDHGEIPTHTPAQVAATVGLTRQAAVDVARQEHAETVERSRQEHARTATSLRHEIATTDQKLRDTVAVVEELRRDTRRNTSRGTDRDKVVGSAEERRAWVRQQHRIGGDVTGSDVHKQFPGAPKNGARIVRQVQAEAPPSLHAVATGGKR